MEILVESTKSWLGQPSRHRTLSQPTKLTKPLILYLSIGVENKNQGKLEVRLGKKSYPANILCDAYIKIAEHPVIAYLISAMSNPSGPLWPASQAGVLIETLPLFEFLFLKQNLKMTKYLKQSLVYRCCDGNVSKHNGLPLWQYLTT